MKITKEQILELMTSAYMTAHQHTVDGVAMGCRQGTLEECEDIFESEFEEQEFTDKEISMAKLLLECRDALPAITEVRAKLYKVDLSLADRIEEELKPWRIEE